MSWARVGEEVEKRRKQLDATAKGIAQRAGVHESSLWKIRNGRGGEVSAHLRTKVDRALRWPPGTIDAIEGGAEPPTDVLTDVQRLDRLEDKMDEMARRLDALLDGDGR